MGEFSLFLRNQSWLTEYQHVQCISNKKMWLTVHFVMARLFENFLMIYAVILLYLIIKWFFSSYHRCILNIMTSNWFDIHHQDDYSLMIIVLKKELKLTSVYICIAFLYTWLPVVDKYHSVSYFNFLRWWIEASLLPWTILTTFLDEFPSIPSIEDICRLYHLFYTPVMVTKLPMFIGLRYVESQFSCSINDLQIIFFDILCFISVKSNLL